MKILSSDFLYSIDSESFRYFLFQEWDDVAVAHQARPKKEVNQIFLNFKKIFLKSH